MPTGFNSPIVVLGIQLFHHDRIDFILAGIIITVLVGIAFAVVTITGKIQDTVK